MKKMIRSIITFLIPIIMSSSFLFGCTLMTGSPSLTFMTRELANDSNGIELIDDVDKISDSMYWVLLFGMFGKQPTHESVVERLLEKHQADILLNAELTTSAFGIPYVFMVFSNTVEGQPACFKDGRRVR